MSLVLLSISTTQAKLTVKIANNDTFVEVRNSESDVNGVIKQKNHEKGIKRRGIYSMTRF